MKRGYLEAYNLPEKIEYLSSNFYKTNVQIEIRDNSLTIYKTYIPGKRIGDWPIKSREYRNLWEKQEN